MPYILNSKKTFKVIKTIGQILSTWPYDVSSSNKLGIIMCEIKWWVFLANVIGLLIPLGLGVFHFKHETTIMMKTLSEFMALFEVLCNLILCKIKASPLKCAVSEIELFIMNANMEEQVIIHKYVNRHKYLFTYICMTYVFTASVFNCAPLFTTNIFPTDAWYPFPLESRGTRGILYILQFIAVYETGLNIFVDVMIATLLWYCTAQLDLLANDLRRVTNVQDIYNCVRKHQHLTLFMKRVNNITQLLLLKSNGTMAITVIFAAFILLRHDSLGVSFQFILMMISACLRLYVTARPADDLKTTSENNSLAVYDAEWIGKSKQIQIIFLILMQRSNKPLVISVSGFISEISLEQYAYFLSTTLSYFMKLRAIIE